MMRLLLGSAALAASIALVSGAAIDAQQTSGQSTPPSSPDAFRFKSGVELVNVTATVSDMSGRYVAGLAQADFDVYEDEVKQTILQFSDERVPVSLGIAIDTSGSMAGEKIDEARAALDRFLYDLLDPRDEIFLYRFSDQPVLVQGWTTDRMLLSRALGRLQPDGGTAMYDTIADAIPLASRGQHQKKALVVISDGNDTLSRIDMRDVKQIIRRSEVLVYAVGIDSDAEIPRRPTNGNWPTSPPPRRPPPVGIPFPGSGGPRRPIPGGFRPSMQQPPTFGGGRSAPNDDRVNADALRQLTDDSGGRTEIVRSGRDLNPATASIADELSKQYYLGYTSNRPKDGKWHNIRVDVHRGSYRVRARTGYVAN